MKRTTGSDILVVDSLTLAIAHSPVEEVLRYVAECKQLCMRGLTVIVVLHTDGVSERDGLCAVTGIHVAGLKANPGKDPT